MASLATGLYDLFAGDPTKTEQQQLGTLGTGQIATGQNLVTPSATYYENLLSGDPSKIAQAVAPAISAQQQETENAMLTGSQFGTRSGGTTAANNAAQAQGRANIINLIGQTQAGAAGAAANLGTNQENAGAGNVQTEADMARARQAQVGQDVGGIVQGAGEIATGLYDHFATPPTPTAAPVNTGIPNLGAGPGAINMTGLENLSTATTPTSEQPDYSSIFNAATPEVTGPSGGTSFADWGGGTSSNSDWYQ